MTEPKAEGLYPENYDGSDFGEPDVPKPDAQPEAGEEIVLHKHLRGTGFHWCSYPGCQEAREEGYEHAVFVRKP